MARRSKEESGGISPVLIAVVAVGFVLVLCVIVSIGGVAVYFMQSKAPAKGPNNQPAKDLLQVTYHVQGNPPPDQRAAVIIQAVSALPGIEPGSVEVSPTTIRFRIAQGVQFIQAHDTIERLGYRITRTVSSSGN